MRLSKKLVIAKPVRRLVVVRPPPPGTKSLCSCRDRHACEQPSEARLLASRRQSVPEKSVFTESQQNQAFSGCGFPRRSAPRNYSIYACYTFSAPALRALILPTTAKVPHKEQDEIADCKTSRIQQQVINIRHSIMEGQLQRPESGLGI